VFVDVITYAYGRKWIEDEGWAKDHVESRVKASSFPGDYLFPGPGGLCARTAIKRELPGIVPDAKLKYGRKDADGITFHSFRHSMASIALNAGVPMSTVQLMGNWKRPNMVARYAHLADSTLRAASAKVALIITAGEDASKAKVASKAARKSQKPA
jgi:integrase